MSNLREKVQLLFTLTCFLCVSYNNFNSQLFIYHGKYSTDLIDYTFQKGELVKRGKVIYPDQSITHNEKEKTHYFFDFKDFSFNDGTLTKNDETIYPNKTAIIENGKLTIHLERVNEPFTIIIEGNFHKRITANGYSSNKEKIDFTVIFTH